MMHVTSAIVETKDKETEKPNDLAFLLLFPSFFDFTDTGNPQTSFSLSRARKSIFLEGFGAHFLLVKVSHRSSENYFLLW
jgi:hypothetical protein